MLLMYMRVNRPAPASTFTGRDHKRKEPDPVVSGDVSSNQTMRHDYCQQVSPAPYTKEH